MKKFDHVDDNFTGVNNIIESQQILKQALSSGKLSPETEKLFSTLSDELVGLESALWAKRVREDGEVSKGGDLSSIKSFNTAVKQRTKFFSKETFVDEADSSALRISSDIGDNNFVKNVYENVITDTALALRDNMLSIASDPSIAQRVTLAKEAFDKVLRIVSEPDISFSERGRFIAELVKYINEILPDDIVSSNPGAVDFKRTLMAKVETFRKNSTSRSKQFGSWSKRKVKEEGGNLLTTGLKVVANTPLFQTLGMSGFLERKIDNMKNPFGRKVSDREAQGIRGTFKSVSPLLPVEEPIAPHQPPSTGALIPNVSKGSFGGSSKGPSDACCVKSSKILQSILNEAREQNNLTRNYMRRDRQQSQLITGKKPVEFKKQDKLEKKDDGFLDTLKNVALLLSTLPAALASLAALFGAKSVAGKVLGGVADKLGGFGRSTAGDFNPRDPNQKSLPPSDKKSPSKGSIPPVVLPESKDGKPDNRENKKEPNRKTPSKGGKIPLPDRATPCMPICNELPNIGRDKESKPSDKDKNPKSGNGDITKEPKPVDGATPSDPKRDRIANKDGVPDAPSKPSKPSLLKKAGGAIAKGARFIPGVGVLAAGGLAAYEGMNASETLGRETSFGEKLAVAGASAIPFVDTKDTAERIISWFGSSKEKATPTKDSVPTITLDKTLDPNSAKQTELLDQLVTLQTNSLKKQNEADQIEEVNDDSKDGKISEEMKFEQGLIGSDVSTSVAVGGLPEKLRTYLENVGIIPKRTQTNPSTATPNSIANQYTTGSATQGSVSSGPTNKQPMQITSNPSDFYKSNTAAKLGISNVPESGSVQEGNSKYTQNILNNMQQKVFGGKMVLTSGFRSQEVNMAVGGAAQSDHQQGLAADIQVPGMSPLQVAQQVASSGTPFDKLIVEPDWVHVSFPKPGSQPKYKVWSKDTAISTESVQQSVSINKENSAAFLSASTPDSPAPTGSTTSTSSDGNIPTRAAAKASTANRDTFNKNLQAYDDYIMASPEEQNRIVQAQGGIPQSDGTIKPITQDNLSVTAQANGGEIRPASLQTPISTPRATPQFSLAPASNDQQTQRMESLAQFQSQGAIDLTDTTISKLAQSLASIAQGNTVINNSNQSGGGSPKSTMSTQSPVSVDSQMNRPI